ncbi:hypothetical protein NM688_g1549 [Phlebia brevispora]|uniref:Uncharacterized protein n=1 Tax=Phlebia brevispora TaxID=194682 RepID=A0ACC1TBU2_9APHY|nr:hypothetical protein NM688_g1549 [Phlebia brevispora]
MSADKVEHAEYVSRLTTPIGNAYKVPIQFFLDHILPPLHAELNLERLISNGAFSNAVTMRGQMWGYTKKSPSGIHSKDVKKAFASLQRGIRAVAKAVQHIGDPELLFCNNKGGQSTFERRTDESLPDAFFLARDASERSVQWSDIAAFGEYQRGSSPRCVQQVRVHLTSEICHCRLPRTKNLNKVTQSMLTCMQRDPRRRFVYAFTIEDTAMRLWFCDRSQVIVSSPFDFIHEYRPLLRFVLSISFASDYRLGWDPTMVPLIVDGHTQYDITVRSADGALALYRTIELLSDSGVRRVLSRGTRVWKATRVVDGETTGEPVALKDTWVDNDRQREGDIHSQVLQSNFLARDQDSRKYFIETETHGDVFIRGVRDRTRTFFNVTSTRQTSSASHSHQASLATSTTPFQVHYRIVYGEVGEPLGDATSLSAVYSALLDVLNGLRALHKSGWVHRDLSIGNVLIVDGVGKLTDLEYAASEAKQTKPGKIGTAYYVAVEVDSEKYLFCPSPDAEKTKLPDDISIDELIARREGGLGNMLPRPRLICSEEAPRDYEFHYNPLHDLESWWWMIVYFTINREIEDGGSDDHGEKEQVDDRAAAQRKVASEFFYQRDKRHAALLYSTFFAERMEYLHPTLADIGPILERMRTVLREAYTKAEKSIGTITFDVADGIYSILREYLRTVVEISRDLRIRRPLVADDDDAGY